MNATSDSAQTIFFVAIEKHSPEQWRAYLDDACGDNVELRARVEQLLAAHLAMGSIHGQAAPATDATTDQPLTERLGTTIGPYKLLQQIGEGGMGVVYMAEQKVPVERRVALKIIKPGMDSRQVIARFEAERQALALMDHPNIAKVLDAGTTASGRPYFVMELVKGIPITKYCDQKHLSLKQRLELMIPVCQAIQHAHQKGIIHRDIKPSNVLIAQYDSRPVPKVIDFGVAKATAQKLTERTMFTELGQVVGTIEYMSPEQAELNQLDIDTRSDIYSLGVLLYELLTGSTPFDKQKLRTAAFHEMLRIIREDEPPKPSTNLSTTGALPSIAANRQTEPARLSKAVRGELDWIVMKALEKDRNRRYETATGFAADIQRYLADEPVHACPPSTIYRFRKFARKHKTAFSTAALVAATLILGTAISSWEALRATTAEKLARDRLVAVELERQQAEIHARLAMGASKIATEREREARAAAAAESKAKQAEATERQRAEASERQAKNAATKADQSAAEAKAVLKFFEDSVLAAGRPDGRGGLGKDVSLRKAVDAAEPTIAAAFKDRPLVEAEVRTVLGKTYDDLGEYELAIQQLQRAIDLGKTQPGSAHNTTVWRLRDAYLHTGKMNEAIALCEENVKICKAELGPDHLDSIWAMYYLGWAYREARKPEQAVTVYEEAFRLAVAARGLEHHQTQNVMNNLAIAYSGVGKSIEALELQEKALTLQKEKLGPYHRDTLMSMNNVAVGYEGVGRWDDSFALHQETVRLMKAHLGPAHRDTLFCMCALGLAYLHNGKTQQACSLFEEIYEIDKAALGIEHPSTLNTVNNLALSYRQAGKYEQAVALLEKTVEQQRAKLPDHPRTIGMMGNLISFYLSAGRPDDAVRIGEEALELGKAKHGPVARETLSCTHNLSNAYDDAGRPGDAVKLIAETLNLCKAKLGPDHRDTLRLMQSLALRSDTTKAVRLLEEAVSLGTAKHGRADAGTLYSLGYLARMYDKAQDFAKAEQLYRETLPLQQGKANSFASVQTTAGLGLALLHQQKYAEAEPLLRQCIADTEISPTDSWQTFHPKSLLGWSLLGQARDMKSTDPAAAESKLTDAEPLLLAGYEAMRSREAKIPPKSSRKADAKAALTESLQRLVELYTEWKKPDEAAKWRKELDARQPSSTDSRSSTPNP